MRTIIGFSLAVLLTCATSTASASVPIHPGVRAGLSVSNLSGQLHDLASLDTRSYPTFAGFARFDLDPAFAIQPEVQYVAKGAKVKSTATDINGTPLGTLVSTFKLDYVEIPVLLQFRAPTGGKLSTNVYVAPTAAFAVNRRIVTTGSAGVYPPPGSLDADLSNDVRSFDFGTAFGGGLEWPAGNGALIIDARYEIGMKRIFVANTATDDKNRAVLVTLGYLFGR